ncbi:MAG: tripartite tricarboxylate transporter substrate binding protein [Pseudomonadota bacterium]
MNRREFTLAALAPICATWGMASRAQAWPDKPVKLLLSQPAGSGADSMARMIGDQLSRRWGQPIVVENRPGGQNAIGAQAAARSAADGYTFYFATAAALIMNAYLFKNLPYDPRRDFTPVGMVGKVPFAVTVNSSSSLKTLQDLIAFAKAHPDRLTVANEGPKTFSGIMTRLLSNQLGIQVNPVPYVSVGAGVTGTVGGQTEALISDVPSVAQMVKAGKLRALAVTTSRRIAGWESVPTISESLPGFDYAGWIGIVAPTNTPSAAVQRFNRDLDAVLSDPEVAARLLAIGPMTEGAGTVDQMGAFLDAEHGRWSRLTKDLNLAAE